MRRQKRRKAVKARRRKPTPKQPQAKKPPPPAPPSEPIKAHKTIRPASAANFIRAWRVFRGIAKQGELAARTGLTRPIISKLESGGQEYRQHHLEKIAAVLHCTPAALLGIDPLNQTDMVAVFRRLVSAPPIA